MDQTPASRSHPSRSAASRERPGTDSTPDARYRTLQVLAALHELDARKGDGSHPLNDIVDLVTPPLHISTVCRILRAATDLGLVAQTERGRYSASTGRPASVAEGHDDDDNVLLMRLHEAAQAPALLYAPALMFGATTRVLVQRIYGRRAGQISRAPRRQQAALRQSPLHADPAGLAIMTQLVTAEEAPRTLSPAQRRIRDAAFAAEASPISGLAMLAAPIWRGRAVTGCLALLPPLDVLGDQREMARLSRVLVSSAQTYSRRTTAQALASGEGLDDAC